jgi:hypothetical protein
METALEGLKGGVVPSPQQMGSFAELQAAVGFPEYYEQEARWAAGEGGRGAAGWLVGWW